jgi:hypothetical protein
MNSCFAIEELIPPTAIVSILTGTYSSSFNPSVAYPEIVVIHKHSLSLFEISKTDSIDYHFIAELDIYGTINAAVKTYWPSQNKNIISILVDGNKVPLLHSSLRSHLTSCLEALKLYANSV